MPDLRATLRRCAGNKTRNSPRTMSDRNLLLRPVDALLGERFFIPSYQRGYRWSERQVTELLDDIWEFQQNCERKEEFYCLQPIVVRKREGGEWELVDGQQRLTTIFLILTYHNVIVNALRKQRFDIRFETRPTSEEFLKEIDLERDEENIDYFHICRAYEAINNWSEARGGSHDLNLVQCLTNDEESGKNVKIIWYELPPEEDPVAAFTRLNVGKIPLTSSELIRALFLRSRNFHGQEVNLQQLKIAQEWDAVEKVLQSDEVWYFLHAGGDEFPSRIEFLFERLADSAGKLSKNDPYSTFHFFLGRINESQDVEAEWLLVKQCFMTLEEWFNDRVLYHLIGYLINEGVKLQLLLDLGRKSTKSEFQSDLRGLIHKTLTRGSLPNEQRQIHPSVRDFVSELDYEQDRRRILSTLLLFNIATLVLADKSNLRFPFDHFKRERWDIEHVHSIKSEMPETEKRMADWLTSFCQYIGDGDSENKLGQRARTMLEDRIFDEFDQLFNDVLAEFQDEEGAEVDNGIGNLTLLDSGTNRSYRNAVFPVKRKRILELEQNGLFVPLCTKNVFLKSYSTNIGKMFSWGKNDRDEYRASIINTLTKFFGGEVGV